MRNTDGNTLVVRVLLVTGRQAEGTIRDYAEAAEAEIPGIRVDVVALPTMVASLITTDTLVRHLPRLKPDYKSYDVVMVPGKSLVDPLEASEKLGVRVVKGPKSPGELEYVLRLIAEGEVRLDYSDYTREIVETVGKVLGEARRLCIGRACIRLHPAYSIVAEVTPGKRMERVLEDVVRQKPDFIVFGDVESLDREEFRRRFSRFLEAVGETPFGVESRKYERIIEALEHGAKLVAGVSPSALGEYKRYRDEAFFVLIPVDETRGIFPRNASEHVNLLVKGLEEAARLGFSHVILDPIVSPPPLGFVESLEPYRVLREAARDSDIALLFSLASIEDAVPTDPFHVYLLGGLIGYELGASVYWVVAKRGVEVEEARAALDVSLASYVKKTLPSDMGLDLTLLGLRGETSSVPMEPSVEVVRVDREVPPSAMDRGYARIGVDDGEIIVEYVDLATGRRRVYRGRDGLSIARLIVRDFRVNPEHAAYLGYELAKAEIAAMLRGGYAQDEKMLPPHERLKRR